MADTSYHYVTSYPVQDPSTGQWSNATTLEDQYGNVVGPIYYSTNTDPLLLPQPSTSSLGLNQTEQALLKVVGDIAWAFVPEITPLSALAANRTQLERQVQAEWPVHGSRRGRIRSRSFQISSRASK